MRIALALALVGCVSVTADAADPRVCRPYATALLQAQMKWFWNRAYTHCLNAEEVHPLPPLDWRGALQVLDPDRTPLMIDHEDVATVMDGMPTPPPASEAAPAPAGRSGFALGTDQWRAWCQKNFPRSWDAKSQTVILPTSRKRARTPCPG